MKDWYNNTTSDELTKDFQKSALKELENLISYQQFFLEDLKREIERDEARAFPIEYPSQMVQKSLNIYNEIARSNGAALVRGKKPND